MHGVPTWHTDPWRVRACMAYAYMLLKGLMRILVFYTHKTFFNIVDGSELLQPPILK